MEELTSVAWQCLENTTVLQPWGFESLILRWTVTVTTKVLAVSNQVQRLSH